MKFEQSLDCLEKMNRMVRGGIGSPLSLRLNTVFIMIMPNVQCLVLYYREPKRRQLLSSESDESKGWVLYGLSSSAISNRNRSSFHRSDFSNARTILYPRYWSQLVQ